MPVNKTEWMIAPHVHVEGMAKPGHYTDSEGETNEVGALMIQRSSGIGTLIIQGRPEDLLEVATKLVAAAEAIVAVTELSDGLKRLYGRLD